MVELFSLKGKKALLTGLANESSIAYGCARALRAQGADLALTYLDAKAEPYVAPLAKELEAEIFTSLNVTDDTSMDALFQRIADAWGKLDILVHSIAFCPKEDLHARVIDTSSSGFQKAMDISVHSFLRMIKRAAPLMEPGSTCMTVSFQGSGRVVDHYNIMGPVKAALESVVRYAANELGDKGITVHALSPGPMQTRAASGIDHFDELLANATKKAPTHKLATIDDVGNFAAFLASPGARNITGDTHFIDGGYSIIL